MNNALYRELKQYIHNEMGITKQEIRDMVKDCVKQEVDAVFRDNRNYSKYVATLVSDYLKENTEEYKTPRVTYLKPKCLDQIVYDSVVKEVSKTVKERVVLTLNENNL